MLPVKQNKEQAPTAGAPVQVSPARGTATAEEAGTGSSSATVALLTVLPFGLAAAWMLLLAKSSQKSGAHGMGWPSHVLGSHACIWFMVHKQGCGSQNPCATGERRFHCGVPFLLAAGALCCMAVFMDSDPSAAFASLLMATVLWGPAGIIYSLPATFLQVCSPVRCPGGCQGPFSAVKIV